MLLFWFFFGFIFASPVADTHTIFSAITSKHVLCSAYYHLFSDTLIYSLFKPYITAIQQLSLDSSAQHVVHRSTRIKIGQIAYTAYGLQYLDEKKNETEILHTLTNSYYLNSSTNY